MLTGILNISIYNIPDSFFWVDENGAFFIDENTNTFQFFI